MTEEIKLNKTIVNTFKVLDVLAKADQEYLSLSELVNVTKLPKTTVHRILQTLEAIDGISKNSYDSYRLGIKFYRYAGAAKLGDPTIQLAKPYIEALAKEVQETINLGIWFEGQVLYVSEVKGENFHLQAELPPVAPLYCSAMGKIFLANLTVEERKKYYLQHDLVARTIKTITEPQDLEQEVETIAREHLAFDNEEYEYGLSCMSVPIYRQGKLVAGLSLSGPSTRIRVKGEAAMIHKLQQTASAIEKSYQRID